MPFAWQKALIIALLGAFLLLAFRNPPAVSVLALDGGTMGTSWSVQLVTNPQNQATDSLAEQIRVLLDHLDKEVFSTWSTESELSRFNSAATGQPHALSAHLFVVLAAAKAVHEASQGAFDPTVAPLVELWGFGPSGAATEPDVAAIQAARSRLGMQYLVLDGTSRSALKGSDIALDLSGIAKGYAVDQVAELLLAGGFDNYLVEIGGEIRLQGPGPRGEGWKVAIETPESDARAAYAAIHSQGKALALAGSGDYRNFRFVDGQRVSHEIDPRSGRPVSHKLAAVTTIAATAMLADAWATALMVLGPDEGVQLADGLQIGAYFIIHGDSGFVSYRTDKMKPHLDAAASGRAPL